MCLTRAVKKRASYGCIRRERKDLLGFTVKPGSTGCPSPLSLAMTLKKIYIARNGPTARVVTDRFSSDLGG